MRTLQQLRTAGFIRAGASPRGVIVTEGGPETTRLATPAEEAEYIAAEGLEGIRTVCEETIQMHRAPEPERTPTRKWEDILPVTGLAFSILAAVTIALRGSEWMYLGAAAVVVGYVIAVHRIVPVRL